MKQVESGADGSHIWSVRYGTATEERATGVCVDANGDVYAVGYFVSTTNIGGSDMASAGSTDKWVAKYRGTDGSNLWGFRVGGTDQDVATHIACDTTRVVVTGTYRGTANFGGNNYTSAGLGDLWVAGYNATNGNRIWSKSYVSSAGNESADAIALSGGNTYVTGFFNSPTSFGGTTMVSQGSADVYVAKYDAATGSHVWSKRFGDTGTDVAHAIVAEGTNIAITGYTTSTINFGGGATLTSAGGDDVFVATLAQSDGSYVDAWRVGGTQNDQGNAVTSTSTGVVVGGSFAGVVYFGPNERTSNGMTDAFVFNR